MTNQVYRLTGKLVSPSQQIQPGGKRIVLGTQVNRFRRISPQPRPHDSIACANQAISHGIPTVRSIRKPVNEQGDRPICGARNQSPQ